MIHTVIWFLIVLGFLVFVHELGHFLVARWTGVRVLRFSIGFGPKIFSREVGGTEYMVAAIPLGGYVKMAGDDPTQEGTRSPDEFSSRTLGERARIVLAGPAMNVLVAFLLMPIVYMIGTRLPAFLEQPPVVGWVEDASPAQQAGFAPGDRLVSVGGTEVPTWESAITHLAGIPDRTVDVVILRGEHTLALPVAVPANLEKGDVGLGLLPAQPALIGATTPGMPAAVAGIEPGDEVVAINDTPIHNWFQMSAVIQENDGAPIALTYRRGGVESTVEVVPKLEEPRRWVIGVGPKDTSVVRTYGVKDAIVLGTQKMWELTTLTFQILGQLFTGNLSIKALGGPIMIAQVTGEAAESGLADVVRLAAFISLQLGIMNLLPIPVLDGGWLVFFLIEAIVGHPLNRRGLEIAQTVGMVLLITLALVVSYNDIIRLIG